jgi:preprotein translocase subunit YajC
MNLIGLKFLLADTPAPPMAPNPTAGLLNGVLLMGGMVLMMWLLIFRPNQKRAKELAALLKSLRAGDKIVTNSGIVGVVLSIKEKTVSIRSSDAKLEILKSAVAEVIERDGQPASS